MNPKLQKLLNEFDIEEYPEVKIRNGFTTIFSFPTSSSTEDVLAHMREIKIVPANLYETFEYQEKHPENAVALVALDSVWKNRKGYLGIPCFRPNQARQLVFYWDKGIWSPSSWFVAIKLKQND